MALLWAIPGSQRNRHRSAGGNRRASSCSHFVLVESIARSEREDAMELNMKTLTAGAVDISENQIDQAIAACGGDPRETVRALLVGQVLIGGQVLKMRGKISTGYVRRLPFASLAAVTGK
jgi:hypothetical protein